MVRITVIVMLIVFLPFSSFSQEKKTSDKTISVKKMVSLQTIISRDFIIKHLAFNKGLDSKGMGEILEVSFQLNNRIDFAMDLYVFVIATYEVDKRKISSLESPVPEREIIRYFTPYPEGKNNYEYPSSSGNKKTELIKFPKDPKVGVNPLTGKTYKLDVDPLLIRTRHLCKYRKGYNFYNKVTVLIFEKISEGKNKGKIEPVYRQVYLLKGKRQ